MQVRIAGRRALREKLNGHEQSNMWTPRRGGSETIGLPEERDGSRDAQRVKGQC